MNAVPASASRKLTPREHAELAQAKRSARLFGLILPLVIVTVSTILVAIWLPRLPTPAATHWDISGHPDGFGAPSTYLWLNIGIGYGLTLMMWFMIGMMTLKKDAPVWSSYQRFMAAFIAGFAVFTSLNNVISVAAQLDLERAEDAPSIAWAMLLSFGLWVVVSVLAWCVQPKVLISVLQDSAVPAEPLAPNTRAVWHGSARPSKAFFWVTGAAVLVVACCAVLMWMWPVDLIARVITLAAAVLVLVLCAMCAWFDVRIDESGLEARSILGWPVFRVPARDIERVESREISPFAEFGGWGMRWAPGQTALVLRAGEGIVLTRTDGRIFAVTLDDADRAAATLASAVREARK